MEFIKPKYFHDADSMWDLQTEAFDLDNTPGGVFRTAPGPANFLLTPDVPKGVLGGMVAGTAGDWESKNCSHTQAPLGLYNKNSEGAPYTNNSAIGSGKVAIYMHGGTFLVYLFETNDYLTPFNQKPNLAVSYAPGVLLYCSPWSLLTDQKPTLYTTVPNGQDFVCAIVSASPTLVTQELGIKLVL